MELKNAKPNGDIVVTSNLNNVNSFWKIVKIEFKNKHYAIFFPQKCHNCPKNKISNIVHLINQH
jgi:hypothetical protein